MIPLLLAFSAALVDAPAERAPSPPPPPLAAAPDPAALAAAREMLISMGVRDQVADMGRRMSMASFEAMTRESERQLGHKMPDDLRETVRAIVARHTDRMVEDLRATIVDDGAAIYARYFTASEILELKRLQSNPVMVKFRTIAPEFMTEMMQLGVTAAAKRQPEIQAEIKAAVEQWAASHRPPPPAPRS